LILIYSNFNNMACSLVFKEQNSLHTFAPYDLKGTREK